MKKYIFDVLLKIGQIFNNPLSINRGYIVPTRRHVRDDFNRVVGDMGIVGNDLRSVTERHLKAHDTSRPN